jgi:hypothetical protein
MDDDRMDGPPDPRVAAELGVIERLLKPAHFHQLAPAGFLIRVGDGETTYAVVGDETGGRFEERQRGAVTGTLTASSVVVVLRLLTYRLAGLARSTMWPMIRPADLAPGVTLESVEDGQRLSWDDDWLLFPGRTSVEWEARPFSWVVRATPDEVAASYRELSGAPLFHIDLAKEAPEFPRVLPPEAPSSGYTPEVRRRRDHRT